MQDLNSISIGTLHRDGKVTPPKAVVFKVLTGDVSYTKYGGTWISKKFNNGDFDYWFVRELVNMKEELPEDEYKEYKKKHGGPYAAKVSVVAPGQFEDKEGALQSFGFDDGRKWEDLSDEGKVEVIYSCAGGTPIVDGAGPNYKKLFKQLGSVAARASFLFGFYMDRTVNQIGSTGWDWLKGDTSRPIREYQETHGQP